MLFKGYLNLPRWLVLLIDTAITAFSLVLAYLLRFNFELPVNETAVLPVSLLGVVALRLSGFLIFRTHTGIIRYTSTGDATRLALVLLAGSLLIIFGNLVRNFFFDGVHFIPYSIVIIEFITTTFLIIAFRILVRITYMELSNPVRNRTNVVIFGAGESGVIAKRALDRDAGTKYKVIAFVDEDTRKVGMKIENVAVIDPKSLDKLLENNSVEHLIISVQNLRPAKKQQIIETCLAHNTKVLNVPPVSRWINGELSFKQIKKVNIEDLLERDVIRLDEKNIRHKLSGKTILITGAAGSIGSEIVRQISGYGPALMLLVDQAESPLYYLELELLEKCRGCRFEVIICDINHEARVRKIFETFKPDVVFHAAAYKHVPMMENNPVEAVKVNVGGTRLLADLSAEFGVDRFVMISTDKAVNPTSVMGASKRIAELYTQGLNGRCKTLFITTRFGNVLGSQGSVIPLFREQIARGGPVTITHPEVTRYFMTIPEACQLVLEAGAMGKGGEIFIFDMGKSVKIVDLAKKMIKLSRLTLGRDIQIVYTGLRPGEKLYEELLTNGENTLPTHHPHIMIARVAAEDFNKVSTGIDALLNSLPAHNNMELVKFMKALVPEYKSQNSVYEVLDK